MLDLPDSATALRALGLTQTVSGTLSTSGPLAAVYSFTGTAGQNLFLDNQTTSSSRSTSSSSTPIITSSSMSAPPPMADR